MLVIFTDITEREKLEKEMVRLERLNLVGEMAASIGHEIRNPMTTVRGFLQMLQKTDECQCHYPIFDLMIEELDRANSIITEFLSLARNKHIDLELKNLTALVKNLLPLIQANAIAQDKNVVTELDQVPDILLDEKEIRQLLLNLCQNGLEAMPAGGKLTICTFFENDEVVLAVRDEGCGMEVEVLEKIGTPFFTTKEKGTGLGLSVCFGIAARHNATIDVETSPRGTTFYLRFIKMGESKTG